MSSLLRVIAILFLLSAVHATGASEEEKANDINLYIEFIEFLGEWETTEGEWTDPNNFESEIVQDDIPASENILGYPEASNPETVELELATPDRKVKQ